MEQEPDEVKKSFFSEWKGVVKDVIITVLVVYIVISFVAQPTTVDGESMFPTLHDEDQLIIEKVSQRLTAYERYDIIVFPYHLESNKYYIKRIIGLPGETVNIMNGHVYIDGIELDDPYSIEDIHDLGSQIFPVLVPEDCYFVMGDNRNNSKDSRYTDVGFIKKEEIIGKGFIRLFPFNSIGFLK